jgi:UDP-2-acetamido-2,6-beta-L-arabino-hexul-4-ose reductase
MQVSVTGSSGFIGKHLIKRLKAEKGFKVKEFDREKNNLSDKKYLDSFVKGSDVIVHLAGANKGTFYQLMETNIMGTKSLLDALADCSPNAHLVFASSFQVYSKDSVYGATKKIAENLINEYAGKRLIKSAINLRLANVYGSGGKPFYNSVIATMIHQIFNNQEIQISGDGKQKRDYIHVDDIVDLIIKSLEFKKNGSITVDICTGKLTSLNKILDVLKQNTNLAVKLKYVETHYKDVPIKKNFHVAKSLFGWEPKVILEQGLSNLVKNYEDKNKKTR